MPGPLHLLVVDDDELDRLAVRRCVSQSALDARTDEAASGEEAVRRVQAGAYDCVLLDWHLPGEDGNALLAELRRVAPQTPVVIFTGRGDEDIAVELMKAGALDYLPKASLSSERIAAGVRHALKASRAAAARQRAENELRAEEARFRTLANAIPQLAWMADANGHRYWVNQRWLEYTGAAPEEAAEWRRFHHPDHVGRVEAGFRSSLESGEPWEETQPLLGRDGTYRWFLSRALPVRGSDGTVTGWLGTDTDITERMRAEQLDAEARKLVMVRTLAGGVAHEINNAMTVVLGFSQFLLDDPNMGAGHLDDILRIQRAADRAASVARQLLFYSRHVTPRLESVALDAALGALSPMIERLLGAGRRFVAIHGCDQQVRIDVRHLEQMLTNLVLNARDAMTEGGTLTLTTTVTEPGDGTQDWVSGRPIPSGRYGTVSVADSGTGMDAETAARIFDPFFTTKPVGQGTGLGLPVVAGLLEGSGGYLTVTTGPGAGTTVTLYFPLRPAMDTTPAPEGSPDTRSGALVGAVVLVVDDEPAVRELSVRALEASACRVMEAAGGAEALELVSRYGPPDLVLTDLMMRGMDGAMLARNLRARWPDLPVLFMSGRLDREELGTLTHGLDLIEKPFKPEVLVDRIYDALAKQSA